MVSLYERQSKQAGTTNLYDTIAHVAEKAFDTLPRSLKRMSMFLGLYLDIREAESTFFSIAFFEGLAGADADIDAVRTEVALCTTY